MSDKIAEEKPGVILLPITFVSGLVLLWKLLMGHHRAVQGAIQR